MIAKRIAKWVVGTLFTRDTRYDTRSRYAPGSLQARGECMMATGKPATAIAIDFISDGDSIIKVLYAPTFGCGKPL